jgi:hypothetical protein
MDPPTVPAHHKASVLLLVTDPKVVLAQVVLAVVLTLVTFLAATKLSLSISLATRTLLVSKPTHATFPGETNKACSCAAALASIPTLRK